MALSKSTRLLIKKTTEAIRAYNRLKKSKIARRQQKRSETRLRHAAELDAAESTLKSVLAGFFSKQVESAISLFEKSQPFDPREWDGELIARCLPAMAKTMGDSMISELESYGINAQKLKSISLDLWKKASACGAGAPGAPGFAVNNTCQSGDKGSSSESNFLDPGEFPLAGSGHLPLNATGSLNDYIRPENHAMLRKFGAGKGVISRELRSEMRKIAVSDQFRLEKDQEFVFGLRSNEHLENQIKNGILFFSGSRSMAFEDESDRAKSYGELTVRVKAPKGSRVFTLSVFDKKEASILPGSSMKITKQSNTNGNRVLEVDLIDDGTSKTLKMLDFFDEQESKKSVSFLTKASTASEWLEQAGESLVEGGLLNSLTGEVDFGFMAEYPEWMRQAIRENLEETFSQDYWKAINDTTSEDITSILQKGAQDGWSVQRIAKEMSTKFVEDGRYPMNRGRLVARTELGHALNGARSMAMDALIEEVGSDLPMRKQWLSVLGTTTRDSHAHLDGVPADKDGRWSLAGVKCRWPGDVVLPAKERCNCQCSIIMAFGMDDESASELISDYSERVAKKKAMKRTRLVKAIETLEAAVNLIEKASACGAGAPGKPGFAPGNTCQGGGAGSAGQGGTSSGPAPEKKKFNPASYVPPVVDSDGIPLPGSVGSLVDVDTSSMKGGTTTEKIFLAKMAAIEGNVLKGSFDEAFKMFAPPITKAKEKGLSLIIGEGESHLNAHKIMQEFQKKLKELHGAGYFNPSATGEWKQIGPQLGTEKGGIYELNGQKYYVKIPDDPNRAKKEVLATELYALATGSVAKAQLIEIEGKPAYATPFLDLGKANWDDPLVRQKAQKDYAIHAWLNNRDAVGAGSENPMDNIKVQKDGSLILVDAGGSFDQKGMGGSSKKKPFDDEASEWFSLKDPTKNPTTAKVFGSMTIAQDIESGSRLGFDRFSDEAIRKLCKERGFPEIGEKLIKRRAAILKNVDQLKKITADAAKSDQPKKDESLSKSLLENATLPPAPIVPPSWQGTLGKKISTIVEAAESVKNGGSVSDAVAKIEAVKAGEKSKEPQYIKFNEWKASTLAVLKNSKNIESSPAVSQESTKPKVPVNLKISTPDPEFYSVNKAMVAENKAIIDAIKTHAQAGDLGTLLQCGLDGEIEIMTGTGLGFEKVEIKSPKVKQYLDSVMKEVEAHLSGPPKAKSGTLSSIAQKVIKPPGTEPTPSSTEGPKKFGYWDVLGSTSPQDFQVPGKNLTPTQKTAIWEKGKKTYEFLNHGQQSVLKSYTGGGYQDINESLRNENPSKDAKLAAKTVMENAHEVPLGAVLTRKHYAGTVDYSKLKPGTVVSDKAILSTSASGKWKGSVKWEMTAGPGVKGLAAKKFSTFPDEDEIILPPNQRMLVTSVEKGGSSSYKIKAVILPTIETQCCDHLN